MSFILKSGFVGTSAVNEDFYMDSKYKFKLVVPSRRY